VSLHLPLSHTLSACPCIISIRTCRTFTLHIAQHLCAHIKDQLLGKKMYVDSLFITIVGRHCCAGAITPSNTRGLLAWDPASGTSAHVAMRCHTYNMPQFIWNNGPCRDPRSAQCSSGQTESTMAPAIANPMAGDKTGFWELTWVRLGSGINEQLRPRQRQDREPKEFDAKPQSSAARDQECSPHGHWITSSQASDRSGRFVAEQVFRDLYQVNVQTSY
jgi:hypothetical protein